MCYNEYDIRTIFKAQFETKVDNLYFALNDQVYWSPKDSIQELPSILANYSFSKMDGVIPEFRRVIPRCRT